MILINLIERMIFPQFCAICGKSSTPLCINCKKSLIINDFPICFYCELPTIDGITHKYCRTKTRIQYFNFTYLYNRNFGKILLSAKKKLGNYRTITLLLPCKSFILNIFTVSKFDIIVPIPPTHTTGKFESSAAIIAKYIAKITKTPYKNIIYFKKQKKEQKQLKKEDRVYNLKESVQINALKSKIIENKKILIVDDVCTTGITIEAISQKLLAFSPKTIQAYTLAKDMRYN